MKNEKLEKIRDLMKEIQSIVSEDEDSDIGVMCVLSSIAEKGDDFDKMESTVMRVGTGEMIVRCMKELMIRPKNIEVAALAFMLATNESDELKLAISRMMLKRMYRRE